MREMRNEIARIINCLQNVDKVIEQVDTIPEFQTTLTYNERTFKALEEAMAALEKQIKKKPTEKMKGNYHTHTSDAQHEYWLCPTCGKPVEIDDPEEYGTEFLDSCECGQRIDWSEA